MLNQTRAKARAPPGHSKMIRWSATDFLRLELKKERGQGIARHFRELALDEMKVTQKGERASDRTLLCSVRIQDKAFS